MSIGKDKKGPDKIIYVNLPFSPISPGYSQIAFFPNPGQLVILTYKNKPVFASLVPLYQEVASLLVSAAARPSRQPVGSRDEELVELHKSPLSYRCI